MKSLKTLVKIIEDGNEAFNKMSKPEKRVAIAQDCIDRIKMGQLMAKGGRTVNYRGTGEDEDSIKNLMSKQTTVEKKLSKAAIETLAIIVYHQPVTRAEIEEIRGVAFGTNTLEILMELNWVKPQGRKDVPGKPIQYGTTEDFLSHFSLQKLSDLPTVDELGSAGLIDSTAIDSSIFGTGKFYKEEQDNKKENLYSNIDEMLSGTLKSEDQD